MNIQLKSLHLRNFLSFGNNLTEVDLTFDGSTLIQGENLDSNGANGAGKTTIINALCYAIYGKPFDNISLQRLVNSSNSGGKGTLMEVRLILEKGDDEFEIYRCRGGSNNIQIKKNNEDITLDSVANNDKFMEELIGISYDLFTKIVIFSGNSLPFLQMPVAQQRIQIEELFQITILSEKAKLLKEKIKTTNGDIATVMAVIKQQEMAVALHQKQIADAQKRIDTWQANQETSAINLTKDLENVGAIDIAEETKNHGTLVTLKAELNEMISAISELTREQSTLKKEIAKLELEIKHLSDATCPYCRQSFAESIQKLGPAHDELEAKQKRLVEVLSYLSIVESNKLSIDGEIKETQSLCKYPSLAAAVKIKAAAEAAQDKIEMLLEAVNPHLDALASLNALTVAEPSHDELNELKKISAHQEFLLKLLTDKNSFIRRSIISQTIPFLNSRLMHYTKDVGLPHIVKFDDDMSCTVTEFGRELDFGNLSSGEKKRVNLSLSLAFRDVLHHLHSKLNIIFIDEIDASLDGAGVEAVFKTLKDKSKNDGLNLWIISHRPEAVGRFDRTLIIRKQRGFSNFIQDNNNE